MARIGRMRREHKWSASRIALELRADDTAISRRTVTRHLNQLGLNRRRFIDPDGGTNRTSRTSTARWPGHMVHLDVNKTGRIPDGGRWRFHGRSSDQAKRVARAKTRRTKPGYTYLHSAIDGFSRLAYTEALPDEKAATAIAFLHRARIFFAAHGIHHIQRIITDNGACYRASDFTRALLGSRHQRITPYTPRHNGKVERYQRILTEESSTPDPGHPKSTAHTHSPPGTSTTYHRPHTAAGNQPQPPASTQASPTS